jgi:hypothetical protein
MLRRSRIRHRQVSSCQISATLSPDSRCPYQIHLRHSFAACSATCDCLGITREVSTARSEMAPRNPCGRCSTICFPILAKALAVTGVLDQNLVACIAEMLDDAAFPKLPFSNSPVADNQQALQAIASMAGSLVPFPFLYGILMQESGCQHFQVPSGNNLDNFVTVGCDTNDKANPARITSRGFGIGQFTLFHHPPTSDEVSSFISDPVGNVKQAVAELRGKFDRFVIGPDSKADDRIREVGSGQLRLCKFDSADPLYLRDCVNCLQQAGTQNIVAGQTPLYDGSPDTYQATQYHQEGSYANVPIRKNIPCDWSYAVRRYNGSGPNSYDYQAEFLLKVLHTPKVAALTPEP